MSQSIYGNNITKNVLKNKNIKKKKNLETNLRGYYAALLTQRGTADEQLKESVMKQKCPIGNFDYNMIDSKREVKKSKIELACEKVNAGKKLTSAEKIIFEHDRDKKEKDFQNDLKKLKEHGIIAELSTNQGLLIQLLLIAKYQLDSNKPLVEKYNFLYHTNRMIIKFDIPKFIRTEYNNIFLELDKIPSKIDVIKLQFNEEHGYMPPCDEYGFSKLDEWQKEGLNYMDMNHSIIFKIPTSGGKTILTGYHFKKIIKAIVCLPSSALCFQVAAMIERITGKPIPVVTQTYQTLSDPEKMAELIERIQIIVGTPVELNNYLVIPSINKIKWDRIIIDEIHMIGSEDNKEMEFILKRYKNVPTTLLSATINNVTDIYDWMKRYGHECTIKIVESDKRFFNLQKMFFEKKDSLIRIHPLAAVTKLDIENGNVLNMTLNETPPDVWILGESLMKIKNFNTTSLNIYKYFNIKQVITLAESTEYFNKLLTWMIKNYSTNKKDIDNIISSYKFDNLTSDSSNLYDVITTLKNKDMLPALIFNTDSHQLLEYVKTVAITISNEENTKYPNLLKERLKQQNIAKAIVKKTDELKLDKMKDKQISKELMKGTFEQVDAGVKVAIFEPHYDFIFNKTQCFSQYNMEEINTELKRFFPQNGAEYHWLLILYWRGIGVYAKGLPDQYLQLIQIASCNGKLAIIFSDDSLESGVNMPFRSVVLTRENINPINYHQRRGRAGRRGFDRVGYTIFWDWTWNEIQTISSSSIPDVKGADTMYYGSMFAEKISGDPLWGNIQTNYLIHGITNEDALDFYSNMKTNMQEEGGWHFANSTNIHFNMMCWKLRDSLDCIRMPFLIKFVQKIFCNANPNNNNEQIEFSKMILNFIDITEATDDKYVLEPAECYSEYPLKKYFEDLQLSIPEKIDSQIFESIKINKLIDMSTIKEKSNLRKRLFKFGKKIETVQNYFFYSKDIILTRLTAKLLTRIYWIYHMSAPVMDSINSYVSDISEPVVIDIDNKYTKNPNDDDESEEDDEESEEDDESEEEELEKPIIKKATIDSEDSEDSEDSDDSDDSDDIDKKIIIKPVSKSKFWN